MGRIHPGQTRSSVSCPSRHSRQLLRKERNDMCRHPSHALLTLSVGRGGGEEEEEEGGGGRRRRREEGGEKMGGRENEGRE